MVQLYHNRNVNKNSLLFKVDYTSKWEKVLKGDTKWLEKYRSSSRYAKENLTADEKEVFDDGWVLDTKSLP